MKICAMNGKFYEKYSNVTHTHTHKLRCMPMHFQSLFPHTHTHENDEKYQILMRSSFLHSTPFTKEIVMKGREKTEYGKILCLFTKVFLTLKFIKKRRRETIKIA